MATGTKLRAMPSPHPESAERVDPAFERQFTPAELGALWKLDPKSITKIFRDERGVFQYCTQTGLTARKREYVTLRIPESVARRVYQQRCR